MVLYNLTPSRELTHPWCESSPWSDSDQHAAYISYRASTCAVLPYVCWYSFYLPTEGWRAESTPSRLSQEWVLNLGPVAWQSAALPIELAQPVIMYTCLDWSHHSVLFGGFNNKSVSNWSFSLSKSQLLSCPLLAIMAWTLAWVFWLHLSFVELHELVLV